MFINKQASKSTEYYAQTILNVCALSRLYSESEKPFIHSRAVEKIFCDAFGAEDLSRDDMVADAKIGKIGIAIKTFQEKGSGSYEKVAEFGKAFKSYDKLEGLEKMRRVAELWNQRLEATKKIYGLGTILYHCLIRGVRKILVKEYPCQPIGGDIIKILQNGGNTITFADTGGNYRFNLTKNTLYKQFSGAPSFLQNTVRILPDPLKLINRTIAAGKQFPDDSISVTSEEILLPLYSGAGEEKKVYPRSGLNQWNAGGRKREEDEVYIQVPSIIREKFPSFFPRQSKSFTLLLPDGNSLEAKLCQQGRKALMSNPNNALGKWILREVLSLRRGRLLAYKDLLDLGIDSVRVAKVARGQYRINFAKTGSYENFLESLDSRIS
jgi:hypothetical protein